MLAAGYNALWAPESKRDAPCCPGRLLLLSNAMLAEAALLHSCGRSQMGVWKAIEGLVTL
jgi:hypothetical protein